MIQHPLFGAVSVMERKSLQVFLSCSRQNKGLPSVVSVQMEPGGLRLVSLNIALMQNAAWTRSMWCLGLLKRWTVSAAKQGQKAHRVAQAAPGRCVGRPAKGETANPHQTQAKAVKNLRYALLKNPEHLSENQQAQLQFLTAANPRLYRAYLLKENLRLALKASADEITAALTKWMA